MASNYTGARDLAGVPDDEDTLPPVVGSTARPGGSGNSPSPIRGSSSSGGYAHTEPTQQLPITKQPFHFAPMAPPSVGPAPPPAPAHEHLQHPPPPRAQETGEAAPIVQVPDLRTETSDPAAPPATAKPMETSSPSQTPHMRPKKLLFTDEPSSATLPTREETTAESASGVPTRRNSSSIPAATVNVRSDGAAVVLPNGKLQVRVTRDGKTTVEEMEPNELAHLYAQQQAALQQMRGQFDFLTVPDWVRLHPMLGPYLAEVTGTFAWVLTLSLTSIRNQSIFNKADDTNVTCLPIGFMFTSMVFTFGYISGGHFNPAISLAVFLIRKMDLIRCLGYIVCQVAAAFCAGIVAMLIQGSSDIFVPSVENSFISSGIFAELIYTFAVSLVVLNIGYSRQSGNFFYGFAVGMTMAAGSASVGHISGGAFNPAAATGLQLSLCMTGSCDDLKSFWIYWLAPLVGAVAASLIYSQMFQPTNTQVLQDHKVLRDPSKTLMRSAESGNDDQAYSESGQRESQTNSASDTDEGGRTAVEREGSDMEMSNVRRKPGAATVLNDSLTEPVVVREAQASPSSTSAARGRDVASLV